MSSYDGGPRLGGTDDDRARAANPSSDPLLLARLAEERPDLHAVLAGNPNTPVYILEWLHSLRRPDVEQALATNRTAMIMGIVRSTPGAPFAPPVGAPLADPRLPDPTVVVPPTTVIPTTPTVPRSVTPVGAAAVPLGTADDDDEPERRRGMGLLLALIPLLFLGGCLAAIALARGGDDSNDSQQAARTTLTSLATAVLPTQVTATSTNAAASAGATAAVTNTPPPTAPPESAPPPPPPPPDPTEPPTEPPAPPTQAATAAPRTTTRAAATTTRATTAATTATTRVAAATVAPSSTVAASAAVQSFAYTIAQRFATAVAAGDWVTARAVSPSSSVTDAQYQTEYGNLDASTVVPVNAAALSVTTYSLRVGLVAHETNGGVKQTSLYCVHWNVDTAKGTLTRVDGTRLRTQNGTTSPGSLASELQTRCAAATLD